MANKLSPAGAYIRMSGRTARQVPGRTTGGNHQTGGPRAVPDRRVVHRRGNHRRQQHGRPAGTGRPVGRRQGRQVRGGAGRHTNRLSREDPMDAIVFYNQLRKAAWDCTPAAKAIDLDDFAKQLLLFVNQKASNDFLVEMSAKTLRGRIANAKVGRPQRRAGDLRNGPGTVRPGGQTRAQIANPASTSGKPGTGSTSCLAPSRRRSKQCGSPSSVSTVRTLASGTWRGNWKARATPVRPARAGATTTSAAAADQRLHWHGPMGRYRVGQVSHGPRRRHCFDTATANTRKASEAPGRRHRRRGSP